MTVEANSLVQSLSERIEAAFKLPNGARFYRCALQVNPFEYLNRHKKKTSFSSEAEYNKAIVRRMSRYRNRDPRGLRTITVYTNLRV